MDSPDVDGKVLIKNNTDTNYRTMICQYDSHNYVLVSGRGEVDFVMRDAFIATGCSKYYNMDGSGSSKLYYQKGSEIKGIINGDGRKIADMLYFSEHIPKVK